MNHRHKEESESFVRDIGIVGIWALNFAPGPSHTERSQELACAVEVWSLNHWSTGTPQCPASLSFVMASVAPVSPTPSTLQHKVRQSLTPLPVFQIFGMVFSMILCCAIRRNRDMV